MFSRVLPRNQFITHIADYSTTSNAPVQRARTARRSHVSTADRAPLQRLVRQRVNGHAAAPSSRALKDRDACYNWLTSAATHTEEQEASPARRRQALKGKRTQMSNATISGREWHGEVMRALRFALRCMVMLDLASRRSPPRFTAAPSKFVTNLTRCF
jgi:hypothetical protein